MGREERRSHCSILYFYKKPLYIHYHSTWYIQVVKSLLNGQPNDRWLTEQRNKWVEGKRINMQSLKIFETGEDLCFHF